MCCRGLAPTHQASSRLLRLFLVELRRRPHQSRNRHRRPHAPLQIFQHSQRAPPQHLSPRQSLSRSPRQSLSRSALAPTLPLASLPLPLPSRHLDLPLHHFPQHPSQLPAPAPPPPHPSPSALDPTARRRRPRSGNEGSSSRAGWPSYWRRRERRRLLQTRVVEQRA